MTDVWPSFGILPHFPPFGGGEPPRDPAVDDWFLEARSMTLDLLTVVESLRAVLSNVDMATAFVEHLCTNGTNKHLPNFQGLQMLSSVKFAAASTAASCAKRKDNLSSSL